jgi:hypothetical protein
MPKAIIDPAYKKAVPDYNEEESILNICNIISNFIERSFSTKKS